MVRFEMFYFTGAISVSLHMISAASVGLFENAIMLSGSSLNPSIPRVKDHLTTLYDLAETLHYPVDNNRDLLEFLREIDGKLLTQRTYQDFSNPGFGRRMANLIWATAVERKPTHNPSLTSLTTDSNDISHISNIQNANASLRSARSRQIYRQNTI